MRFDVVTLDGRSTQPSPKRFLVARPKSSEPELRRTVTPWGSFSWGYSDVGADIFVGLGLVLAWAAGASNVAFLFAGVVYVCIGLAYTELAATYPVAGGGQYFVMRGLGDIFGFIAGWAVLLDFTIDVTLFAWTSVDYTSQLVPSLVNSTHPWLHFIVVFGLVARAVPAQRDRRAREHGVQRHRLRARRAQRDRDPLPRLPVRVPAAAADPHDAVATGRRPIS